MEPGEYCIAVTNTGGRTGTLPQGFTVLSGPPDLRRVIPSESYGVPADIHVYGFNFAAGIAVRLGNIPLDNIQIINLTHLHATVPAVVVPGTYSMTASYEGSPTSSLPSAFTVLGTQQDLYGQAQEMWVNPGAPHVGQPTKIGMVVHRQGGDASLPQVLVRFSVNNDLIGDAATPPLASNGSSSTEQLNWVPSQPGEFVLTAMIDPHNQIVESSENNNMLTRTVTILPPAVDTLPPRVESLTIAGGRDTVTETLITLDVSAVDLPQLSAAGVSALRYIEFEYNQASRLWIPVQDSDWLAYAQSHSAYPWVLTPIGGVHYIQAWAKDTVGNISAYPYQASINYTPLLQSIDLNQTQVYRRSLAQGERLHVTLRSESGDADLYVWPPDWQSGRPPWVSNVSGSADDTLDFVAPTAGVYQIEVYGFTDARYELILGGTGSLIHTASNNEPATIDPTKILLTAPIIDPNNAPPINNIVATPREKEIYLPVIRH